jgi:hypothetical protein
MPLVSKAQQRWAFAHQDDKTRTGDVAREFIAATPKGAYKKLPARKKPKEAPKRRAFGTLAP